MLTQHGAFGMFEASDYDFLDDVSPLLQKIVDQYCREPENAVDRKRFTFNFHIQHLFSVEKLVPAGGRKTFLNLYPL